MTKIADLERKVEAHKVLWWIVAVVLGVSLRFLALYFTDTVDPKSFYTVGSITAAGKNIYANFREYNYGPLFSIVLAVIYKIAACFGGGYIAFKFVFVSFLAIVDIFAARLVAGKTGSSMWGMLFFVNPVSIVVEGYNGQFDSLAIMLGAYGAFCIEEAVRKKSYLLDAAGIILLSMSLIAKHILWMFPVWILLNKNIDIRRKLFYAFIPPLLFLLSFAPYWAEGAQGIIHNVFQYRSSGNMPLFGVGIIKGTDNVKVSSSSYETNALLLAFGGLMLLNAYAFRRETFFNSFLLYTIAVLCCTSGASGQQEVIPCMAMIVLFREKSIMFFIAVLARVLGKQIGLTIVAWCLVFYLVYYYRNRAKR